MKYRKDFLEGAHKHSIFNRKEILKSSLCGCFYCMQNFSPNEMIGLMMIIQKDKQHYAQSVE
jgi:hypothetical protein